MTTVPEHSHPPIEERLSSIDSSLQRHNERFDSIDQRLDRLDIEVGMILDTLNQHTRTLAEIRNMLRRRNGDTP